jgi:hypothetical protein
VFETLPEAMIVELAALSRGTHAHRTLLEAHLCRQCMLETPLEATTAVPVVPSRGTHAHCTPPEATDVTAELI